MFSGRYLPPIRPPFSPAISPPAFCDFETPGDYREFADNVRDLTGGIPIGFKLSAQHIERDIEFALEAGADYIIRHHHTASAQA